MPVHPSFASFDDRPTVAREVDPDVETGTRSPITPAEAVGDQTLTHRDDEIVPRNDRLPEIPGFRVVRRISGGGMGDVYEVIHLELQEPLALKMIRIDKVNSTFLVRFEREAKAMRNLHHSNIARFYDFGRVDGCPYITMHFIRGATLRDHLHEYQADIPKAVALLLKIADAVQYVHDKGYIHRDLKPSNILLDESGEPILCDFGLVKNHSEESILPASTITDLPDSESGALPTPDASTGATVTHGPLSRKARELALTNTGDFCGTYSYSSPEQSRGAISQIGPKTDIWALGVILYEMITGQRPFSVSDTAELLRSIRENPATKPSEWNPQVDARLDQIVLKCLEKAPDERHPSAGAFADELRQWLHPSSIAEALPPKPRRLWIRWLSLSLTAAGIALVLALNWFPGTPSSVGDNRFDFPSWARAELAAGKSIELLDDQGKPAWDFPIIAGRNSSKIDRLNDQWTIHTTNVALLQLLDDPGIEAFILRAEIHANSLASIPKAGLYVAHSRIDDPTGIWNFQLEAFYEEDLGNFLALPAGDPAGKSAGPQLKVKHYRPDKIERIDGSDGKGVVRLRGFEESLDLSSRQELKTWNFREDKPTPNGPWRTMEMKVLESSFTIQWDNRRTYSLPLPIPDQMLAHLAVPLQGQPGLPPKFKARGGLGIVVEGGSASFRRIELIPNRQEK